MYYDYRYYYRQQDHDLITNIAKAIDGEFNAIQCYNKLLKMVPTTKEKNVISEIIKDENDHLGKFTQIYFKLTGRQPDVAKSNDCPKRLKDIFEFSFEDEQESVDFYLDIANATDDENIREVFTRAAADEQNHAIWFLYFLTKTRL
ncbi:ferritin-like domain-containing protein [Peribacillus glennii]|uniref:Ferritin-like domain-containing protein n=1 Tax=Peribacillus glennii TaxID=2303991 RepID=A0A372LBF0_9BACI|nr:ferritin-like domain-containing protein [Peribacillus glennii]RFU62897.1 ferritin-like domain-containing protein [Peribacillus glennii]